MHKSIFLQRIIALLAAALLLAGALSAVLYTVVMQYTYIHFHSKELLSVADAVVDLIRQAMQTETPLSLHELLRNSERKFLDARLLLFDGEGKAIFAPPENPTGAPPPGIAPPPNESLEQEAMLQTLLQHVLVGENYTMQNTDFIGGGFLIAGAPIIDLHQEVAGAVVLIKPLDDFSKSFEGMQITMLLSTVITFLIMLVPGYFAARRLTIPLIEMRDISLRMAEGDFSLRVDESQRGEIGELAVSLNRFAIESERLEKTRRDYVANVSHELRTPIAAIRSMSETLCDDMIQSEAKKKRYYRLLLDEALRLSRLIDDLLELSRLQAGESAIKSVYCVLNEVIEHAVDLFRDTAEEAGVLLHIEPLNTPALMVYSNPDRLEQVLIILLDNALRHTKRGDSIIVSVSHSEDRALVRVCDSGEGIPQEDLPHIFERFYKVDKSRTANPANNETHLANAGAGLGLSIAREVLSQLGEEISVCSTLNEGACFSFTVACRE